MQQLVQPAKRLQGIVRVPGDKSISHRYAILSAIAEGTGQIRNYSTGADCRSTLGCLESLGVPIEIDGIDVRVQGRGLNGLRQPSGTLDAGNSGSTIRMLAGVLAGQPFPSCIAGDASLSRRPMERIMVPLRQMGARIDGRDGRFPPIHIEGGRLQPIDYTLPVASAQVKTCVLLAGLYASGVTTVREPEATRDHTELALAGFGAEVVKRNGGIAVTGLPRLRARELTVPGDLSSAAFFLVAALVVPGSSVVIQGVGLNPTRTALVDFLASIGASIQLQNLASQSGELAGDIYVRASTLRGGVIEKGLTAALIDEIPVLAVLGAISTDGLLVRDARELRLKESDRIATVAENLRRMGVSVDVHDAGFFVPGGQNLRAAALDSFGDHRIAMAFAVASLKADGECRIDGAEAASVSFPEFYEMMHQLTR